jgi:hypothetical protein
VLEIGPEVKNDELNLKYDRHWLAILRNTNHLLSVEKKNRFVGSLHTYRYSSPPKGGRRILWQTVVDSDLFSLI